MTIDKEVLTKRINVASNRIPADIVVKNGRIIDVFNREIIHGDIAIADGYIVGIGDFEGKEVIDADNRYVCPSFIDGHVHIESSMVTPSEFAKAVIPHGVTTVITDPHEIANVAGKEGIQFMIDDSENVPMDIRIMLPSCVPATPFENNGAQLNAEDLQTFFSHKRVLGLAEVMDYPSVLNNEDTMIDKLVTTSKYSNFIDGHAAGLNSEELNVYAAAGIGTDHECNTASQALERLQRGMYVLIREGSAAKDLTSILPLVNDKNARRFLFCTDDKHLDDLVEKGSIDHNVRLAIKEGLDPLLAIQMASLNAAECYGLKNKGAIAPGYAADFLLLDNLDAISISAVYTSGKLTAEDGKYVGEKIESVQPSAELTNTIHVPDLKEEDLDIPISGESAHIIGVSPNSIVTNKLVEKVQTENGVFVPSASLDQMKLAVIERHSRTGNIGLGIVKGLEIKEGAIASTVAHDSHNLVTAGANDQDVITAINTIKSMNGGLAVVKNEKVIAALSLNVAGLISDKDSETVCKSLHLLNTALSEIGCSQTFNPFLTLAFLTLPVIPALKLTDKGLFNVEMFSHISVDPSVLYR
ncbi:adenine deaminase [Alteribacillus sp. JSM 102045]|uniref:adenine deaminase n=1 Tax=Alteribacillus sp. JSM 102045 TaxID=1562101 RepID=UPI0035C184F0